MAQWTASSLKITELLMDSGRQHLKIGLLFDQELSVVVPGVVAVALEPFHRLGDVKSPRDHTAVAV